MVAAFACVGMAWLAFALMTARVNLALIVFYSFWPSWAAMVLFWIGRAKLARLFWLLCLPLLSFFSTLYYGSLIDPELVFLALIGFPLLFFSWQSEKMLLWITFLYVGVLSILSLSLDYLGPSAWAIPPEYAPSVSAEAIDWGIRMSLAGILLLELAYFAYLVQRSAEESAEALYKAEASARAKGQFLANMSHEIRTPMNGMIGMIEVMENSALDESQRRSLGTIRNSAFSLLRILDDILDASKIDAGKLTLEQSKVELRPLVEGAAQTLQTLADTMEVRLRMLVSPSLPEWIRTDSGRLRQIILNLLSNAIKYSARRLTGQEGTVTFHVTRDAEDQLVLVVKDTGIGMSEAVQSALFQPFAEGDDSTRRQVGGTGLGLAITQSIVQLMGGQITVDSTLNEGTEVRVTLPLQPARGPIRQADISGMRIICFDLMEGPIRPGIRELMDGAQAHLDFARTVAEATALCPSPDCDAVFLILTPDQSRGDSLQAALRQRIPQARVVRFSAERHARYGLQDPLTYLIQIYPMMGTELFRALAQLDGRIDEDPPHGRRDPTATAKAHSGPAQEVSPEGDSRAPTDQSPTPTAPDAPRVLVVEDNEINRTVLGKQLEILGYGYEMATNGVEAMELCQNQTFDLILCDCHMPLMDGFAFTAELRREEQRRGAARTPIIAVTANAMQGEAERCRAVGMDDYLAKPVELDRLGAKMRKHLQQSA